MKSHFWEAMGRRRHSQQPRRDIKGERAGGRPSSSLPLSSLSLSLSLSGFFKLFHPLSGEGFRTAGGGGSGGRNSGAARTAGAVFKTFWPREMPIARREPGKKTMCRGRKRRARRSGPPFLRREARMLGPRIAPAEFATPVAANCAEVCLCLCHLMSAKVCARTWAKEALGDGFDDYTESIPIG